MSRESASVDPHETIYLPMRRRFIKEYVTSPEGNRELHIYYGRKEISFEELDLHPFGEQLFQQDEFMAGDATRWSEGEPYAWKRVKELLEALLTEGILTREAPTPSNASESHRKFLESEARRVAPTEPLWWNPDAPKILQQLVGRPLELGFLEAMLPVHRLAHPALDAEGRHVGESNVFPEAMRMKKETEFRTCQFPGSRYRDAAPMNVTALKSMSRHWKSMMHGILAVREAFLRHNSPLPDGRWRLGDLHAVACAVLAVPTLQLMRANEPVSNGTLDPVLSNMFRVTDGVRMVTAYLLFLPEEPMTYDTPISSAELLYLTERDNHFLSNRGVCAGPPKLVEEFFATLMDGKPVAGEPPARPAWAHDIPAGIDYGLRGLQLYSLQFNLWSHMCRAYEVMHSAVLQVEDEPGGFWGRLRERVERDFKALRPTRLHTSTQRDWAEARYIEMFDRAQRGLSSFREDSLVRLRDVFTPAMDEVDVNTRQQLRDLVRGCAGVASGPRGDLADAVADATAEFLAIERSTLRALDDVQREVNALLQRPHPTRRFSSKDLALHHRLRIGTIGLLPYLLDVFRDELGVDVDNSADGPRLSPLNSAA